MVWKVNVKGIYDNTQMLLRNAILFKYITTTDNSSKKSVKLLNQKKNGEIKGENLSRTR